MTEPSVCTVWLPCTDEELTAILEDEKRNQSTSLVIKHCGIRYHENFVELAMGQITKQLLPSLQHLTIDSSGRDHTITTHAHFLNMLLQDLVVNLDSLTLKNFGLDGTALDMKILGITLGRVYGSITLENISCRYATPSQYLWRNIGWNHTVSLNNVDWDTVSLECLDTPHVQKVSLSLVTATWLDQFFRMLKSNHFIETIELTYTQRVQAELPLALVSVLEKNKTLTSVSVELETTHDAKPILRFLQEDQVPLKHLTIHFNSNVRSRSKAMDKLLKVATELVEKNRVLQSLRFVTMYGEDITAGFHPVINWYLKLNCIGRQRLITNAGSNDMEWINAVLENADDASTTFFLFTKNPSAFSTFFHNGAQGTAGTNEAVVTRKRKHLSS